MVENNVSPDGTVLFSPTDNGPWRISDLSSDLAPAIDIASAKTGVEIVWSEDSQFALFLSSEALWLYDRQSATVTTLRNAPPLTTLAAL